MGSKAELVKNLRDMRPVGSLILLPDDPRDGDVGAISESFKRFGQQKPIVVNSEGVILAGNHMYRAAVALGWEEIWVNESDLPAEDQTGYVLADNRVSDLATYNNTDLIRALEDVGDLTGTGYTEADLDTLKRITETYGNDAPLDPYASWGDMPPFKSRDFASEFTTVIHFLTMDDADEFFKLIERSKARIVYWPQHDGRKDSDVNQHWLGE